MEFGDVFPTSRPPDSPTARQPIRTRDAALLAAIVSVLTVWIVWGAIDPLPLIEDEYSYVLQSRIFASGHWAAPSPPAPEFFQQAHVITQPVVASKFFPGTALLMSIGAFLGAPVLMQLILTGLTGALLFLLVRRVSTWHTALIAFVLWLSDPLNLRFRAGYFSEITTEAMWVICFWALLEWRERRQRRWMVILALAMGWGAITRPLTMLAFAVPVGILVLRDVGRTKRWSDLAVGIVAGSCVLAIIPLWSAQTTGNWKLTPQTLYTKQYIPYDKPGFGVDSTPPLLALNPVNRFTYEGFFKEHVRHTPANLPKIAFERLRVIAREEWKGPRLVLVPFVVLGLFSMNAAITFALGCSIALFLGYLSYGHWAEWPLYYFEALPILAVLAGLGAMRFAGFVASVNRMAEPDRYLRRTAIICACASGLLVIGTGKRIRFEHARMAAWDIAFRNSLSQLPMRAAVIFVHFAPGLRPHSNVVLNSPNLAEEPYWIVNDLGGRNHELMQYAGPRIPLSFQEDGGKFEVDRSLLRR
jgi:hypothetical protein